MFKNVKIYRYKKQDSDKAPQLEGFVPCSAMQEKSIGFVPPREDNGEMIEVIHGDAVLKIVTETKRVPSDILQRKAAERASLIEETQGRKPGKKEMKEIKEDAKMSLLPNAFPKRSATSIIFTKDGFLIVGTANQSKADDVITMLVKSFEGLQVTMVNTNTSPQFAMSHWLIEQEPPFNFTVDRECELKAFDESKAVVKYGRHPLDIDEVRTHVQSGKLPTKLAMTFDSRISFILTDTMSLNKIEILGVVFEEHSVENSADKFDADIAIIAGELRPLLIGLVNALGGEVENE